jgi:hypothetical protein
MILFNCVLHFQWRRIIIHDYNITVHKRSRPSYLIRQVIVGIRRREIYIIIQYTMIPFYWNEWSDLDVEHLIRAHLLCLQMCTDKMFNIQVTSFVSIKRYHCVLNDDVYFTSAYSNYNLSYQIWRSWSLVNRYIVVMNNNSSPLKMQHTVK